MALAWPLHKHPNNKKSNRVLIRFNLQPFSQTYANSVKAYISTAFFSNGFEVMVFYIFVANGKQTENGKTQSTGS